MADWYVDSAATGTGSGASWANAKTLLESAASAAAAGDRIFVASTHNQQVSGNSIITFPGTQTNPNLVISVNKAGSVPPVGADYQTGAQVTTLNNSGDIFIRGVAQIWGIHFTDCTSTGSGLMSVGDVSPNNLYFKDCVLELGGSTSSRIQFGNGNDDVHIILDNTQLKFNNASAGATLSSGRLEWRGTASAIQGTTPTKLFNSSNTQATARLFFHGVDLSALSSGHTLFTGPPQGTFIAEIFDCQIDASLTLYSGSWSTSNNGYLLLVNTDSGATGYRVEYHDAFGDLTTETTITLATASGGASDGTQKFSWKIVTSANASKWRPFISPPILKDITTVGGSLTKNLEFISSSSLNNDDIWALVEYLGSSAHSLSSFVSSGLANPITANAAQSSSSATWDSSPSTPQKQYMTHTFTPQLAGLLRGQVHVGKASTTVYVNPAFT